MKAAQKRNTEKLDLAHEDVRRAIMNLASVRDVLSIIEEGRPFHFNDEQMATFARTTLIEAGGRLERAAETLGICEFENPDDGYFPEARHHG